jgi:hypothetical protein
MKGCRIGFGSALAAAILGASIAPDGSSAPAPRPREGVVVLDDCDPDYQGKILYEDNLTFLDAAGKLGFRVSDLNNCESIGSNHMIAGDPKRGWVWVVENVGHRVHKYDRAGKELLVLNDIKANALAVDPDTGDLWVLMSSGTIHGEKTVVFDAKGKQRAEHNVGGWDIAYNRKSKSFWIAGRNLAKVRASQVLINKPIAAWCAASIAVHPTSGVVWVAVRDHPQVANSKNELLSFDNDGNPRKTIPLGKNDPFRVSVDGRDGTVWLTLFGQSVQRYTAEGKLEGEHELHALAAEADPRSGGAWVVTPDETLLLDRKGKISWRVPHKGKTSQAWIAAW